jgi:cysteine desulfurase
MKRFIYLDHHATTPCDPRVVQVMLPYFAEHFGNPSSQHGAGRVAANAVENARGQLASLVGAIPKEIVFTGGSTESDNLALLGVARAHHGDRRKIITLATEHKAILNTAHQLEREGFELVIVPVDSMGRVDLNFLESCLDEETLLVSAHLANNEVGTIQPLVAIAEMAHRHGALVHSDATQAVGKIPVNVDELDVDLMSISAHKMYGPKGVGALFVRGGPRAIPLSPLVFGGGQEWSSRSGTYNVPGIVGFGEAASIAQKLLPDEVVRLARLRNELEWQLAGKVADLTVNGDTENRLPGSSSLRFLGVGAEALIANLPGLALSTGSACNSGAPEPSYILLAMGLSREEAYATLRVGIGRFNTEEEIRYSASAIFNAVTSILKLLAE